MKKLVYIDTRLINAAHELLASRNMLNHREESLMLEDALRFLLYGITKDNKDDIIKDGKDLAKERLYKAGIGEPNALGNYTKGLVHTWANKNKVMKHKPGEKQVDPVLEEVLKEVINETTKEEQEYIKPRKSLFRDDGEEITQPSYTSEVPPWQDLKKIAWNEVNDLYSNPRDNPFLLYAKNKDGTWNEIRREAIMSALAQLPPPDRTSPEAWKLVRALEEKFRSWQSNT